MAMCNIFCLIYKFSIENICPFLSSVFIRIYTTNFSKNLMLGLNLMPLMYNYNSTYDTMSTYITYSLTLS